ncbi:MAG: AMP-binding protein [Bacteroidales bacterium]|nr:AMP-binding protein [Bacteroidales bacterium]
MFHQYRAPGEILAKTFHDNWECNALSNYGGEVYKFKDVAGKAKELHLVFESCKLKAGDTVAICGKNHANWAVSFLAVFAYGAVPVPLLHEFTPANIHHLVNHSESKLLFVDEQIWKSLDIAQMQDVKAVIQIETLSVIYSKDKKVQEMSQNVADLFARKYPEGFTPDDFDFYRGKPDELAIINYTSGTSGFSKGVMLPHRSFWSNMDFGFGIYTGLDNTTDMVSILPSAHMYGLMFEIMYQLVCGTHVHFLTRVPSPKIITEAMGKVKPRLVIAVPLVIEKIYKNILQPVLDKPGIRFARRWVPFFDKLLLGRMRKSLIDAFGGNFTEVIIGGAAFNKEVEAFFHKMKFPFTVGYGMTECGPIITYSDWKMAKVGSSGKVAPNMELRIDSSDPEHIPGEIQCKGANVFLGYFKNEEATKQVFTDDGWFKTGDMGIIDKDGYLFIKGRCKCMLLGPSGQNIYPEELESVVNNQKYVVESLVIEDKGALVALVYPDYKKAERDGLDRDGLQKHIEADVAVLNKEFPVYSHIKSVELLAEDFERTPKKSIKRYLYQR